jgi:uncharacterized protein (DUF924 family)
MTVTAGEPEPFINDVLNFWFGPTDGDHYGEMREAWFEKDSSFDADIRHNFLDSHRRVAAGELDQLAATAQGALALIIVLDQFSRNMFREQPGMYATDPKALAIARSAMDRGFDQQLISVQRIFLYLPFEHSEVLADQEISVRLFGSLPPIKNREQDIKSALRHREIVERFGRFPHRNHILGRETTPEEIEFLKEPHSSF